MSTHENFCKGWEPKEFHKNEIGEDLEPLKEYKEAVGSCVQCIRVSVELQSKVWV